MAFDGFHMRFEPILIANGEQHSHAIHSNDIFFDVVYDDGDQLVGFGAREIHKVLSHKHGLLKTFTDHNIIFLYKLH